MENGYLCLSRKFGESIYIGDNIVVTLGQIKGSQARILISAPKNISVHRDNIKNIKKLPYVQEQDRDVDFFKVGGTL